MSNEQEDPRLKEDLISKLEDFEIDYDKKNNIPPELLVLYSIISRKFII